MMFFQQNTSRLPCCCSSILQCKVMTVVLGNHIISHCTHNHPPNFIPSVMHAASKPPAASSLMMSVLMIFGCHHNISDITVDIVGNIHIQGNMRPLPACMLAQSPLTSSFTCMAKLYAITTSLHVIFDIGSDNVCYSPHHLKLSNRAQHFLPTDLVSDAHARN